MIHGAAERGADVLILDLEDGVHPDHKESSRARLGVSLRTVDFGHAEVLVRINSLSSEWGAADLEMVARSRPSGVVVPKTDNPSLVREIDDRLGGAIPLYLMVETAAGVLAARELACSAPRVSGLIFGAADFRESIRAGRHPEEMELHFARSQILVAARAACKDAFDTPWFAYQDLAGLEGSAWRVRQMGFDGKTAVHPRQVPVINDVFSPTPSEVARARRIVSVMEQALKEGRHVATMDGEMVEALHLDQARRTLARADALGR